MEITAHNYAFEPAMGLPRDPAWERESKAYLAENLKCCLCRQASEVVHHVVPVHVNPKREMDKTNWSAVCIRCHFSIGHLCNWRLWQENFFKIVQLVGLGRRGPLVKDALDGLETQE